MARNLIFLNWLFDRSANCAALRESCSLYERQAVCAQDAIAELSRRNAMVLEANDDLERRLAEAEGMLNERDGLIRELFMERLRNDEMKRDFKVRYGQVCAVVEIQRTRLEHLELRGQRSEDGCQMAGGPVS